MGICSPLPLLAAVLVLSLTCAPAEAGLNKRLKLDLSLKPQRPPDLVFNDSWVPKIVNTPAGAAYRPDLVDWSSVIQSVRTICQHEMRICNWCTRAAFHDGGANTLDAVGATVGTKVGQVVTAPAGGGGLDASLLLTPEQLRPENSYDSFSTFVAATVRNLVGFYDISYADGLAVCGATAREMLTYGQDPVYSMMPAVDVTYPVASQTTQPFLVGRLDNSQQNGAGILPGATFSVQQFADWFRAHFARGVYDGVALLGSHALLDNQGCVKSAGTTGPFAGIRRMFSWNSPNTYYAELFTPSFAGPIDDLSESTFFRSDLAPQVLQPSDVEVCKFTSPEFKAAALSSVLAGVAGGGSEPTFDWLDKSNVMPADADYVGPASGRKLRGANTPVTLPPRPAGYRERRTCDSSGVCYDGWPYTQNDGFLGQAASNTSYNDAASKEVRTAAKAFLKKATWSDAYGHAFVRLLNNGATFVNGGGIPISGWECKSWVAGDGTTAKQNTKCQTECSKKGGCPKLEMTLPVVASAINCRCSTAPWGAVAMQRLYPNSTQTTFGGIQATPSGLVMGRKMLQDTDDTLEHHAAGGGGGQPKAKCPFHMFRGMGLL